MRKLILIGVLLMSSFYAANAQFATSFEASEGFTPGQIAGQNEWAVSTSQGVPIISYNIFVGNALDGANSLEIVVDENFNPSQTGVNMAAIGPAFTGFTQSVATVNIMITVDEDEETDGSNYAIQFEDAENATSRIEFGFDGTILVVDMGETDPEYIETSATWLPGEWMKVDMIYDFGANTINYYLNGELIFEGTVWSGTAVERFVLLHDNWPGSVAYVDDVNVYEGTTVGVKKNSMANLSVFPNPATNIVNVAVDALVSNVAITDLNGRTVKSVKFDSVSNASVNVSDLASGVYMMTVSSDKGITTKKIVKN